MGHNQRCYKTRATVQKKRKLGGLGAIDISLKTKIAACKITASGITVQTERLGNSSNWKSEKGSRKCIPYYKLMFSDFTNQYKDVWKIQVKKYIS